MKTIVSRGLALTALGVSGVLVASLSAPVDAAAFTKIGGSLGQGQRDFRVFNNFTDASANNNTVAQTVFPGQLGAVLAIWKGHTEWASDPWAGTGAGDGATSNPVLGSGGANFDNNFQGTATSIGTTNDNVHSELAGSQGSTLAFTETPISDGWRIRYLSSWVWQDGPGPSSGGIDIQGVATHEIGHTLGLGHTSVSGATMTPFISGAGNQQRSIEADDINGIKSIYGAKSATKPHIASLSGSKTVGGTLVITGSNFAATSNEVWFTRQGNLGNPQKVFNLGSNGTKISVVVPAGATDGTVMVKKGGGTGGAFLSNSWPIDIGSSATQGEGFTELHPGLGTAAGAVPYLTGGGDLTPGSGSFWIEVDALQPAAAGVMLVSLSQGSATFKGGTLYASPVDASFAFGTAETGQLILEGALPASTASGISFVLQAWFSDADGPQGAVATNGLLLDVP
ncbi:MAG TPA: matrixin family metalloprotease [Planctomycetota bacterium]|nr:matrixin family metalloprotease [Planctomycetota bacterium]